MGMSAHDEERFRNEEGMIQDRYRIGFLKEHLHWDHKAIDEGSLCIGFHVWAAFDCWSWNHSYRNRYGLVEADINDQKRRIKASGLWYKDVAGQKGFAWDPADARHI